MLVSTFRTVRSLPSEVQSIFIATLIFRAGTMAFPFLSAYLLGHDGLSVADVGAVIGAYGVGALVADIAAGPILKVASTKTVMITALAANAGLVALLPALDGKLTILMATIAWGFFYEAFTPASYSAIVNASAESIRKVAFSCHRLAINLGMAVGPALGGLLFAWNKNAVFGANAAIVLVAALFLFTRRGSSTHRDQAVVDASAQRKSLVACSWREESRFWSFFVLALPIHFAFALPPAYMSAYVINDRGLSGAWVGAIFTLNAVLIVLFEVPLNKAMQSVGHRRGLLIGYGLTSAGFALMGLFASVPGLLIATVFWSLAEMIVFPALMHYASDVSGEEVLDRNMGLYSAGVSIGLIAAPGLALSIASTVNASMPWLGVAGTVALAAVVIVFIKRFDFLWLPDQRQELAQ